MRFIICLLFALLCFGGNIYAQDDDDFNTELDDFFTEDKDFGKSKIDDDDWIDSQKPKYQDSSSEDSFYKAIDDDLAGRIKSISEKKKPLTADFSFKSGSNREVKFINNSTSATYYKWDFGDGSTSTVSNPTYTYASDGRYTVILTVKDRAGRSRTVTQIIEINGKNRNKDKAGKQNNQSSKEEEDKKKKSDDNSGKKTPSKPQSPSKPIPKKPELPKKPS